MRNKTRSTFLNITFPLFLMHNNKSNGYLTKTVIILTSPYFQSFKICCSLVIISTKLRPQVFQDVYTYIALNNLSLKKNLASFMFSFFRQVSHLASIRSYFKTKIIIKNVALSVQFDQKKKTVQPTVDYVYIRYCTAKFVFLIW